MGVDVLQHTDLMARSIFCSLQLMWFQVSWIWTKVLLDKKFGVLFDSDLKIAFRLKVSWNAPFFDLDDEK